MIESLLQHTNIYNIYSSAYIESHTKWKDGILFEASDRIVKASVIFNLNLVASLNTFKQPIPDNAVSDIFKINYLSLVATRWLLETCFLVVRKNWRKELTKRILDF